ncbi:Cys-Gln thioester bond-forming surface protein, partial [Clostridium perfringens]
MKKFFNKLSFFTLIIFSFSLVNVFASEKEYWAYIKATSFGSSIFIEDDGEKVAYCYNQAYNQPGSPYDPGNKTYYTRSESYLNNNDELMDAYGKEKKERIAAILTYGYPLNSSDLISKYGITKDEARYITQQLLWTVLAGYDYPYDSDEAKYKYYDKLLELSKTTKFEQGILNLVGNFKFKEIGKKFSTEKLYTTGNTGSFTILNLPENMVVKDWNTDEILNNKSIPVGKEFYIESSEKPNPDLKLKVNYKYQDVKFYFYKYSRGGVKVKPDKPYQSLIRAELEDKINEKSYEISIDGNFDIPGLGGTTPNLPGEEGTTPQLPGDSGLGGTTPNLPGEEGTTPQLPGDSGLGGTTPNLPGEEGTTPQLPGDSGLGGTTPNLPGEEGTTPQLPGDSGLGGTTPNLPGEEGTTPQLPGDSGLGGTTPNLPGEEGTTPQLPGDSGLGGTTPNLPGEEGTTPQLPGDSG